MADQEAENNAPQDDLHRKFREALERKKGAKHANNGPHDAEDKGLAAAKDVKVKREFRRKSG
jgi:hypothetical protein